MERKGMGMDYFHNSIDYWVVIDIISLPRTIATGFSNTGSSLSGVIVSISISAFILYYLYRAHVKAYFGRATF